MKYFEKFGVPALAGSCASEARRNPTKVGTPNATQNLTKLLFTCLIKNKLQLCIGFSVKKIVVTKFFFEG